MVEIVIGVTGTKAAGKDEFIKIIEGYGFVPFSLADIVREQAQRQSLPPTIPNLQDIGNRMRKNHGNAVLAEMIVRRISELPGTSRIAINSIRHPAEIDCFQEEFGQKFLLVGIDAHREIRRDRYLGRKATREEDFSKDDRRDFGEEQSYGQHVARCLGRAQAIIINNDSLEELREKTKQVLRCHLGIGTEKTT